MIFKLNIYKNVIEYLTIIGAYFKKKTNCTNYSVNIFYK